MRLTLLVGLILLVVGIGAGCASTNGSSDGGGTGGSTGLGGSATGGASGRGGAGAGGGAGQSTTDCSPACQTDQICVGTGTQGGALIMPNDAGVCPAGSHVSDPGGVASCQRDLAYACAPMPSSCNGTLACDCAGSLCPYICQLASSRELLCVEEVP